jgi:flavin reductase (DIM6/NTAB) family NADH-FMN oxidoreductase RutF
MKEFKKISAEELNENFIDLIGNKWMLITASKDDKVNTMTASWGGVGELWNKNVAFTFIRPTRYTYEFVENNELCTLSFFDEEYREKLAYLGKVSGRDEDKIGKMGLTVVKDGDISYFEEAKYVLVCRKLYKDDIEMENFTDMPFGEKIYEGGNLHRMYINEILYALKS